MSDETAPKAAAERRGYVEKALPTLDLQLPADLSAAPLARRIAEELCESAGISSNDCDELILALGEAVTNAVVHGSDMAAADACIFVRVWDYRDHMIVQVQDQGPGFDPPEPPYAMPSPQDFATGGRGLPLMQNLTDGMIVTRGSIEEGGVSIYLLKRVRQDGSGGSRNQP